LFYAGALADDLVGIGANINDLASAAARMNWQYPNGQPIWPPHNGAVPGTERVVTLSQGQIIDRIGGNSGNFLAPEGTPFGQRVLPATSQGQIPTRFEVRVPFDVQSSTTAPWFGQPGGGTQFFSELSVADLIRDNILRPIP
jgi:hypothetical protein